ncbi:hypothetical protein HUU53_02140 [Candidatus Micrarchaeota archaeon]|nr:hypothetical protein [Candidatus Micrarchaeota archaeon]
MVEVKRQLFHITLGLLLAATAFIIGKEWFSLLIAIGIISLLVVIHYLTIGYETKLTDYLIHTFDRRDVIPFKGALTYLIGILFAVTMLKSFQLALGVIIILAVGDGFSTLIGHFRGHHKLPYNEKKSFEGVIAFIITAFIASSLVINWQQALFYSVFLGLIESLDFQVDDNLAIPGMAWVASVLLG